MARNPGLTRARRPGWRDLPASAALALVLATGSAEAADDGESVFMVQKCNLCHAVPAADIEAKVKVEAMKGPSLPTASLSAEIDRISRLLRQEGSADGGKKHPKKFGGSDEELAALLGWLAQLPPHPAGDASAD